MVLFFVCFVLSLCVLLCFANNRNKTILAKMGQGRGELVTETRGSLLEMMGRNGIWFQKAPCLPSPLPGCLCLSFLCELPFLLCVTRWAPVALFLLSKWTKISLAAARGQHESLGVNPDSWEKSSQWYSVHLWSSICGRGEQGRDSRYKLASFHLRALYIVREG